MPKHTNYSKIIPSIISAGLIPRLNSIMHVVNRHLLYLTYFAYILYSKPTKTNQFSLPGLRSWIDGFRDIKLSSQGAKSE